MGMTREQGANGYSLSDDTIQRIEDPERLICDGGVRKST